MNKLLNFVDFSREEIDYYVLYILASKKPDLHITDLDRASYSQQTLERDSTVAKVWITVLDVNDNPPIFEKDIYFAGVNAKATINELVTLINATDMDMGANGTMELLIASSNLYKFGSDRSTGSIVPSPFGKNRNTFSINYFTKFLNYSSNFKGWPVDDCHFHGRI